MLNMDDMTTQLDALYYAMDLLIEALRHDLEHYANNIPKQELLPGQSN